MRIKLGGSQQNCISSLSLFKTVRSKTTSAQYVDSRFRDPTFEKFMDKYKNYAKVVAIQDLILAGNDASPSISLDFLNRLSQKLHLNRGASSFLRKYPHVFHIFYDPTKSQPLCKLTDAAVQIAHQEARAINDSLPLVVERLVRLLLMSGSNTLPLRAIFKVWRELGLPDDFEESVISRNSHIFQLHDAHEPNTHILKLCEGFTPEDSYYTAAVENWRVIECCREDSPVDKTELQFRFKHGFPPGMRLNQGFKEKVKKWQRLPYVGPYEKLEEKKRSKAGMMQLEKGAVAIVHEFLSLTVEKMVEVEKISHFRTWFGIDFNIRDLFLDHPGIFYLSTKGKTHTVFLREAYQRGCLIEPNPVYCARRKLFDLVVLGRHALFTGDQESKALAKHDNDVCDERNENYVENSSM